MSHDPIYTYYLLFSIIAIPFIYYWLLLVHLFLSI